MQLQPFFFQLPQPILQLSVAVLSVFQLVQLVSQLLSVGIPFVFSRLPASQLQLFALLFVSFLLLSVGLLSVFQLPLPT